jgi:hypothetical protein
MTIEIYVNCRHVLYEQHEQQQLPFFIGFFPAFFFATFLTFFFTGMRVL